MLLTQPELIKGPACHPAGCVGAGASGAQVVFVGIAPGADEVIKGTPFTGPSGQLLDAVLEAVGYPRSQVYTTNLICWFKNDPTLEEILECWPRLKSELDNAHPKLIIPLGEIATDFLLGNVAGHLFDNSPTEWSRFTWAQINQNTSPFPIGEEYFGFGGRRGRTTWSSALSAYVLPTYHPAGVLRGNSSFISDIVRALSKIPVILDEYLPDGLEAHYDYHVVHSIDEGNDLLRGLPRGRPGVALDIETNYGRQDIDWFSEDLLCLSITWDWNSTAVIPGDIAKRLDWGNADGVHWIGQNFIFDSGGLRKWLQSPSGEVNLPIGEDTMFQSYVLDERPGRHDLETLGGEWCAAPFWKSELAKYTVTRTIEAPDKYGRIRTVRRRFREVPDEALFRYNAGDTTFTYRSYIRQQRAVCEDDMDRVYRDLLLPAANAFREIQYRGLYIDQERQLDLLEEWYELKWALEDQMNEIVHQEDPTMDEKARLNFGSHPQMARFMYDILKAPVQYRKQSTHGGYEDPKVTTDKNALEVLKDFHPFFTTFHDWRQTDHQISVSEGVFNRIKVDGMLHAIPMIHGTETGRLSYQDPNLQNWAQPWIVGDNLARIREIIAPINPETHFIAEADYRQIELWMAWMWSQDVNMKADLDTGDFHRVTAMSVFNKKWEEVTTPDRFWTKIITFGRLYERGAEDMKRGRGFENQSIAELNAWIQQWQERYWGYVSWSEVLKKQAREEGVIVTPWGRKRRYYLVIGEGAHHALRSALNFCMQSTAHDYTLSSLIAIQPQLARLDSYILTENHDAILFEISRKYANEALELITDVMTSVRPNSDWPTLKIEWKGGPNWGQCHEFEPSNGIPV